MKRNFANYYLRLAVLALTLICLNQANTFASGENNNRTIWKQTNESEMIRKGIRKHFPKEYQTYTLDFKGMKKLFQHVPMENLSIKNSPKLKIALPHPDGCMVEYEIVESPIMEPGLAEKFPEIKTYSGQGISDPTATMRISVMPNGFQAMVISVEGTYYIDPYGRGDVNNYLVYHKDDYIRLHNEFVCYTDESYFIDHKGHDTPPLDASRSVGEMQTYRLAIATTGEFADFHGGTTALAMAAITSTVNRVNTIYERDLALRMILVADNDQIVYLNGSTDPFTNPNNLGTSIDQNQTNTDDVIGSANYDIGHLFIHTGGGLAYVGAPCDNGYKARAASGNNGWLQGDPFDVDYVSHEMGHQMGAHHTFNTGNSSCGSNRSANSAYEPGSGSTPMSYAGLCGSHNLQSNCDDYYHYRSLFQITGYMWDGFGASCQVPITNSNNLPTSDAGADYNIPISTPFTLTGTGSDPDGDAITYCWEQYDLGPAGAPDNPSGDAPIFRSFLPTTSPARTFPKWDDIVNNTSTIGEILPTYDRTMHFKLTVRDNNADGGLFAVDEAIVDVIGTAGPFTVTAPNTAVTWEVGQTQTVTWDVANTNQSPISCANVDILLSTDGGYTYPITLATGVTNDGSHDINVPNELTTQARVMVKGSGNIFFDISNQNFTIEVGSAPTFTLDASPASQTVCAPNNGVYTLSLTSFNGFNSSVSFSATGNPTGTTVSFSPNTIVPTGTVTMTIGNTNSANAGTYNIDITATGGGMTQNASVEMILVAGIPSVPVLSNPADGATGVSLTPSFTWNNITDADTYHLQVSINSNFSSTIIDESSLTTNTFTPSSDLNTLTTYYWRVSATNDCGTSAYSSVFDFETYNLVCDSYTSTDVPITIPDNDATTVTSSLDIAIEGTIQDINVMNLEGTHDWIADLYISLISPEGTTVDLMSGVCNNQNNFDINYDDEAAPGDPPCPPTDGNTYQPSGNLSDFIGENMSGTWTLSIYDEYPEDGGSLNAWTLDICYVPLANPDFDLAVSPASTDICTPDDAVYTVDLTSVDGYSDAVTLSTSGEPAGTTVTFSTNPVTPTDQVDMTISNTSGIAPGTYSVIVTGTDGTITKTQTVSLTVENGELVAANLLTPADGSIDQMLTPVFDWGDVADADTYEIEIATDANFTSIVENSTGLNNSTYTSTGLDYETQYFWRVIATNTCGSVTSATFDFTTIGQPDFTIAVAPATQTICTPDDAVYDITLTSINSFSNALTLSTSGQPTGSSVVFSTNPVTPTTTVQMTITDTENTTAGTYNIDITATDGTITKTQTVSLTVENGELVAANLLTPADGSIDQMLTPVFDWGDVADADTYEIEIATDANFTSIVESSTGLNNSTYTSTGLDYETQYFWRVIATNTCGSVTSATFDFTTIGQPDFTIAVAPATQTICTPDDAVYDITLTSINSFSNALTLSTSGQPTGSSVVFSTNPVTPTTTVQMTITDTENTTAGTYNIDITATDGTITKTQTVSLTVENGELVAANLLTPADGSIDQMLTPVFDWGDVADADTYEIEIATDANFISIVESSTGLNNSTYTSTGLDYETQYFWRVIATNTCGSVTSATFDFTTIGQPDFTIAVAPATQTICTPDDAVYDITLTSINSFSNALTLSTSGQPTGSSVVFSTNPVTPTTTVQMTITDTENTTSGTYNIDITATDGTITKTQTVSLTVENGELQTPVLISPADQSSNVSTSPVFSWVPVPDADSYEIFIATDPDMNNTIDTQGLNSTTYTVNGLDFNTNYYWMVLAINDCGASYSPVFNFKTADQPPATLLVDVNAILGGVYDSQTGLMSTDLNEKNLLPLEQPFNRPPWNYAGSEEVTSLADDIVDWVLIEIRADDANKSIVAQKAVLLRNDGQIMDLDGSTSIAIDNLIPNHNYSVIVRHRNHLAIMSSTAKTFSQNGQSFDLTNPAEVNGGEYQLMDLGNNKWGMLPGDFNSNGVITVEDYLYYKSEASFINQYIDGDLNLDNIVTITDFNIYFPNASKIGVTEVRY